MFDSSRRFKDPGSVVALEKEGLRVSFKLLEAAAPSMSRQRSRCWYADFDSSASRKVKTHDETGQGRITTMEDPTLSP